MPLGLTKTMAVGWKLSAAISCGKPEINDGNSESNGAE
jgi:hypothetical protein